MDPISPFWDKVFISLMNFGGLGIFAAIMAYYHHWMITQQMPAVQDKFHAELSRVREENNAGRERSELRFLAALKDRDERSEKSFANLIREFERFEHVLHEHFPARKRSGG